jgi:HEAT repeat protein
MLGTAATSDPSPVVRAAAIDALGRFRDPRAVKILIAAYHKADGLATEPRGNGIQQASAFQRADSTDPLSLLGPAGFEPAFVTTLRSRALASLAKTNSTEAVAFLANVAAPPPTDKPDPNAADRDVRSAAIRGLGQMRSQEAVVALTRVLKDESGRDVVLAQNAHSGLKELTGQNLPADPEQWGKLVQTGVQVSSEPNMIQRVVGWISR